MSTTTREDETFVRLLRESRAGSGSAARTLFLSFYGELRAIARHHLLRERRDHTLAPTSLVHEAFVRLHGVELGADDREHFLRLAATVMRHVLVDSARRRQRRQAIEASLASTGTARSDPILRLDEALERLGRVDARLLRTVELRFLVGLDVEAAAQVLGCSTATVKRDWRTARAFLQREIERDGR
jgi:RNA polymerase sigma factor (TIGR02999 family)